MNNCILDGYTYPYNPVENPDIDIKAVSETATLEGRVFTVFDHDVSRMDIEQKWPLMEAAFYQVLRAKALLDGELSYTHDDGVVYTVIVMPPKFQNKTPGGDAYVNVTMTLHVVSSP